MSELTDKVKLEKRVKETFDKNFDIFLNKGYDRNDYAMARAMFMAGFHLACDIAEDIHKEIYG